MKTKLQTPNPSEFPHKVPELHAWRGVIYRGTSRKEKYTYFKLVYVNAENQRKTLGFDSIEATMEGVVDLLEKMREADGGKLVLGRDAAAIYRQAMAELAKLPGAPALNLVIADYVGSRRVLGPVSNKEAADYYAQHRGLNLPARTVAKVVEEMLAAKRAENLSTRYVDDLENRLERFGKDCNFQIADLTAPTISAWLRGLGLSPRSQNNFRTCVETLTSFAKSCGYLPRHWNEMEAVPRVKDKGGSVEIFTPEEICKLLTAASNDKHHVKLLPFVAIGAFAGLRSAEIARLSWDKLDLQSGHIKLDAAITKTHSRRIVPIQPNLAKWLAPHAQKNGKVCPYLNVTNELLKLAKTAGVEWKANGLRHSYGSYRTAQTADFPRVSYEMGNSPAMIKQHYHELVDPVKAATWFAIEPGGNVVPMSKAA